MSERADWRAEVEEIHHRRELAKAQGGPEGIARQRRRGLSTIRERIDGLLDAGSFREHGESFSVQELLDPRETRPVLAEWLELVRPSLKLLLPPSAPPPWPL